MTEATPPLRKLYPWFTVLGLLVGGLVIAAFYKDQFRDWKNWQRIYQKQELARSINEAQRRAAARIPIQGARSRGSMHDVPRRRGRRQLLRLQGTPRVPSEPRPTSIREIRLYDLPSGPGAGNDTRSRPRQRRTLGAPDAGDEIHRVGVRQVPFAD